MRVINYLSLMIGAMIITLFSLSSCSKDSSTDPNNPNNPNNSGNAKVNFHLTDDPAAYDAVYIDIQQVEVKMEGAADASVFPLLRPGIYNLLDFRNGIDTLLVSQAGLPAGTISQIRLILGNNNSVVVNGVTEPLNTPSAQQSGLKLNLKETLEPGLTYDVWIDFDAGKSIVETGNGKYNLKPVIRAYSDLTDGRVKGNVGPSTLNITVYMDDGAGNIYSAIPNANGDFMFTGLPEGTYTLTVDAADPLITDYVQTGVVVKYGTTVNIGGVIL